jgi:hypothetical protein
MSRLRFLVAVNEGEVDKLAQAEAKGVTDLIWLSAKEARARTRACGGPSAAVSLDRHHRQPRLHAGAQRRRRGPWRHAFESPVLAGRAAERGLIIETGGAAPLRIAAAHA